MSLISSAFIRLLHWNCDGIAAKVDELTTAVRRWGVHIVLLNELRSPARHIINIKGYITIQERKHGVRGGVAMLVREDVPHRRIQLGDAALVDSEAIAVQLADHTVIMTFYNSPQRNLSRAELDSFFRLSRKVVIAADFNAKHVSWGCRRNNRNGGVMREFVDTTDVLLHDPGKPTHFPHNGTSPNTLDLLLSANVAGISLIKLRVLPSDHSALEFSLGGRGRTGLSHQCVGLLRGGLAALQSIIKWAGNSSRYR